MNEILKFVRNQKKLSQNQVAEYLGVSRQMYIKYENGETELSSSAVKKLCELYDVSANTLLGIDFGKKEYVYHSLSTPDKTAQEKNVPYTVDGMNMYLQQILQLLSNLQVVDKISLLGILASQIQEEKQHQQIENSGHPKFGLAKGQFKYPENLNLYDDEVAKLFGV